MLAIRTLSWIPKALRPLQVAEFQHALTMEVGATDKEKGRPEFPEVIVKARIGLEVSSGTIRLAHFTIEEFSRKASSRLFPGAEHLIAETCLMYSSFDICAENHFHRDHFNSETRYLSRQYPPLNYAVRNWGFHAQYAFETVKNIAEKFLKDRKKAFAASQMILSFGPGPGGYAADSCALYFWLKWASMNLPLSGFMAANGS